MNSEGGAGISDETISALREVIAEENPQGTMYAWKIHDGVENRTWLSLSDNEAREWETIKDGRVTIVTWDF